MSDSSADRNPVDRLAEEFAERLRRGEHPSLAEYLERYPHHADEIRDLFPALVAMEHLKPAAADLTGPDLGAANRATLPQRLGEYRILREVGRGGMGVVYEAEQESLGRRVALKVLPQYAPTDAHRLERFRREARAAARLHHTNIVPVFGVGESDGLNFYVMQFIHGQSLSDVQAELRRLRHPATPPAAPAVGHEATGDVAPQSAIMARSLLEGRLRVPVAGTVPATAPVATPCGDGKSSTLNAVAERSTVSERGAPYWRSIARLGAQAADALAYAHGQGILHRDVKPSNLLLDIQGTLWVTDFGLAKAVADGEDLTRTGDVVGTLRYMAPERFRGQADSRSDTYALGLTLYELLTLQPAFSASDRTQLIHQVMHIDPPRPRSLDAAIPRDLETIVLKAADKYPERRYQSAADMAEDLRRFADDRPILARPVGSVERLGRWCRRNPVVSGLIAAVILVTVVGFVGVLTQWQAAVDSSVLAKTNEEIANRRRDEIQVVNAELLKAQLIANRRREEVQEANDELLESQEKLRRALYISDLRLIPDALDKENLGTVMQLLERQIPQEGEKDLRNFEWHYWNRLCRPNRTVQLEGDRPGAKAGFVGLKTAFSTDGTMLAGHDERDGQRGFKVWDTRTGAVRVLCQGPFRLENEFSGGGVPVFSADGTRLAAFFPNNATAGKTRNEVWVWDAATGQELWHCQANFSLTYLAFRPDGSRLAACAFDDKAKRRFVKVWDTATGKPVLQLPPYEEPTLVDFLGSKIGNVGIVVYSPDGMHLVAPAQERNAAGEAVGRLLVWDATTGAALPSIPGPTEYALPISLSFSQDGDRLAVVWAASPPISSGLPNTSAVWLHDPTTGKALALFSVPSDGTYVTRVNLNSDGSALMTQSSHVRWSGDHAIQVWDTTTQALIRRLPVLSVEGFGFDPRGRVLSQHYGEIETWEIARPQVLRFDRPSARIFQGPFLSADGKRVAASFGELLKPGTYASEILVIDAATGAKVFTLKSDPPGTFIQFAMSDNGKRLMIGRKDPAEKFKGKALVWDVDAAKQLASFDVVLDWSTTQFLSSDGNRAAAFGEPGVIKIWDVPTGRELLQRSLRFPLRSFEFSPDGDRIAIVQKAGPNAPGFCVVDLQSGKDLWTKLGYGEKAAFSLDNRRLAIHQAAARGREMLILDAATGEKQLRLEADEFPASIRFSPDGERILTVGAKDVKLWDAKSGEELLTLLTVTKTSSSDHWQFSFSGNAHKLVALRQLHYNPSHKPELVVYVWDATPLLEVIADSRKDIEAAPKSAYGYHCLGLAFVEQKKLNEAIGAFRKAIEIDPKFAPAYLHLAMSLHENKEWKTTVAAYRKLIDIAPRHPGAHYNAACYAALAAGGQAEDTKNLPDKVRQMLRRQALGWLRAELALYAELSEREDPAAKQTLRQRLGHWQQDADLASVRDRTALDQLPDDERKEWRQLWDDVAALLKKVEEKK